MPLLLNVLRNADGPEYKKLRVKAMECAGLIGKLCYLQLDAILLCVFTPAIAVGRDIFRPDANTLVELMMRIQSIFFRATEDQHLMLVQSREPRRSSGYSTWPLPHRHLG